MILGGLFRQSFNAELVESILRDCFVSQPGEKVVVRRSEAAARIPFPPETACLPVDGDTQRRFVRSRALKGFFLQGWLCDVTVLMSNRNYASEFSTLRRRQAHRAVGGSERHAAARRISGQFSSITPTVQINNGSEFCSLPDIQKRSSDRF